MTLGSAVRTSEAISDVSACCHAFLGIAWAGAGDLIGSDLPDVSNFSPAASDHERRHAKKARQEETRRRFKQGAHKGRPYAMSIP
jgi:hypothetical protein